MSFSLYWSAVNWSFISFGNNHRHCSREPTEGGVGGEGNVKHHDELWGNEGFKKKSTLVKTVWSSEFSFFCPDCQEKCSRSSLTTNIWILSQHGSDFYSVTSNSDQTVQNGHKLNPSQPSGCQTSPEEGKVTESSGNIAPFKPVDERTWSTGSFSK